MWKLYEEVSLNGDRDYSLFNCGEKETILTIRADKVKIKHRYLKSFLAAKRMNLVCIAKSEFDCNIDDIEHIGFDINWTGPKGITDKSHIPPQEEYFVFRGLNDFRQILYKNKRYTTEHFNEEHRKSLAFIKRSVAESTAEHVVVVTHHLPTLMVVAPEHKNSLINSAFATELGGYIADSRIDAWIFGHSHTNIGTIIGRTRIVCNQMGYVFTGEHLKDFKGDKFIEV